MAMFFKTLHISICCLVLALAAIPWHAQASDEDDSSENQEDANALSDSGLPIPRFVSLKFEEVNLRTGPGRRYPIRWVYKHKHMPMEVVEEFGHWRKVRDFQGDEGWAHKSQLSGTRMAIFTEETVSRRYPEASAPPMLKVQKLVIGQLLECEDNWCEMQIESYKSWIPKKVIWGVYPHEKL